MASENSPPPSFSARQRWGIFISVLTSIVAVLALVAMLNYLGARYYMRFMWSNQTSMPLSAQTVSLVKSITNPVSIVVYYDKSDKLYGTVAALLDEYRLTNPKISVRTVDYLVDAIAAQQVAASNKLGSAEEKNLVIFNCEGRRKIIPANLLGDYTYSQVPNDKQPEWERHLQAFEGEKYFSAALLSVNNSNVLTACFLGGHGEHSLDGVGDDGYQKFAQVLAMNCNVQTKAIQLLGTNEIPADCRLLIIAGPRKPIPADELEKIRQYLKQGGRLFVLFNSITSRSVTGLEAILADWNVSVGMNIVTDTKNTLRSGALAISLFTRNTLVAPLIGSSLAMDNPRSITKLQTGKPGPETPKVELLAYTGEYSLLGDPPVPAGSVPVMATAEKSSIKGVLQERGSTAILAVGDSAFLSNVDIDTADNRDFAGLAVSWLLDQTQLLQGVGPHPIKEYKLMMTNAQMSTIRWVFLAAMPGAILALGGLVWFRRRR